MKRLLLALPLLLLGCDSLWETKPQPIDVFDDAKSRYYVEIKDQWGNMSQFYLAQGKPKMVGDTLVFRDAAEVNCKCIVYLQRKDVAVKKYGEVK